jgi:predicted nucleic acid-binding Zn ribbon protein
LPSGLTDKYQSGLRMPIYNFRDKETGEESSILLKISELDEYKEKNPHLTQFLTGAPGIARGVGGFKNDDGWKENMSRIAEAHPNSALADKVGGRNTTKAKVAEVAKKHGRTKSGSYKMDL